MEKTILKFPKNDSVAYFLTINKIEKELDSAYMTVKENPDDTEPLIKKSLGAGISLVDNRLYKNQLSYKIQLDGADTQFMEVGVRYFFDIKGTIGNAQKTFRAGELILSETATGYLNPATTDETTMIADVLETDFATGAQSEYVETEVDPVAMKKIGDMTKLDTTEKGTIVKAINEVKKAVDDAETPLFTEATARENIESGEKQPTLWGKVKKWFSSLKALAFKDKVGTEDITDGAVTTAKFSSDAKCPNATNATNAQKTDFSNAEWSAEATSATLTEAGTYQVLAGFTIGDKLYKWYGEIYFDGTNGAVGTDSTWHSVNADETNVSIFTLTPKIRFVNAVAVLKVELLRYVLGATNPYTGTDNVEFKYRKIR